MCASKSEIATATAREHSKSDSFQTVQVLAFIDSSLTDYQSLMAGTLPGVEAILLQADKDGIEQITEVLGNRPDVTTVHLVSHGAPGCLYLGNSQLSLDTLDGYASQLQTWFEPTSPLLVGEGLGVRSTPTLLIYGCNVAAGDAGEEFVTKLHQLTGAKVVASAKRTGNEALGGDWELEVVYPKICSLGIQESPSLAFLPSAMAVYSGVLVGHLS
jgi:hypothetical protein